MSDRLGGWWTKQRNKMAMRWKKNQRPSGLAGVCAGPQGSTLRVDGVMAATVYSHNRSATEWYWVAGWDMGIPHKNTCGEPPQSEADAKAAAQAYVKQHMSSKPPNAK